MTALNCEPLHPLFAAAVPDLDLATTPGPELVRAIGAAMDQYAVLVFPGQDLDEAQQMALTQALGPIDMGLLKTLQRRSRYKLPGTIDIANVDPDSNILPRNDPRLIANIANQLWHSDSSFKRPAACYSLLYASIIPASGGATEFADMRAAYTALPDDLAALVQDKVAEHAAFHSRIQLGDEQYSAADLADYPVVDWDIVRTHPGCGRRSLFIGAHAQRIHGMSVPEGRMLLAELLEHATQREFVFRHEWQPGDLVMWDNRAVLHRGRRYDFSERRELRRTTTEDR